MNDKLRWSFWHDWKGIVSPSPALSQFTFANLTITYRFAEASWYVEVDVALLGLHLNARKGSYHAVT